MAHIDIPSPFPGIQGLFDYRPETAKPMRELAQVLLRGPSSLAPGERELIAAHVSSLNNCRFCMMSHGAAASYLLEAPAMPELVEGVRAEKVAMSPKLQALLAIAGQVQKSGTAVTAEAIAAAKALGATDPELHDTVLIAAAFCMYNRYVDGLATWTPEKPEEFRDMGAILGQYGYVNRPPHARPAAKP